MPATRPAVSTCTGCDGPIPVAATGPLPTVCVSCKARRETTRAGERHRRQRAEARALAIAETLRPEVARIARFEAMTATEPLRRDLDDLFKRVADVLREVTALRDRVDAS